MTCTLSNAISRVRSNFDEATTAFLTDTDIMNWLNDGLRDLSRRAEDLIVFDTSITITANVSKYVLPLDVVRLHRAEFVPAGQTQSYPVTPSTFGEMDAVWGINQASPNSFPTFFVTLGYPGGAASTSSEFKIQLYPVPSQAGTLNLFYYRLPHRFTNAATEANTPLDIVEGWDDLVVLYAEYNALRKDRDERWKDVRALYDENVEYVLNVTRRFHDQQSFMTSASRAPQPSWLYGGDDW